MSAFLLHVYCTHVQTLKVRLLWLFAAVEAGSCRATFLLHAFHFFLFQFAERLFEALVEHEKIAPFHRLTRCFCRNRPVLFKCTGLVVAFRLLCFEMPISQRQGARRHMAEKFILTHTHTHTHTHTWIRLIARSVPSS